MSRVFYCLFWVLSLFCFFLTFGVDGAYNSVFVTLVTCIQKLFFFSQAGSWEVGMEFYEVGCFWVLGFWVLFILRDRNVESTLLAVNGNVLSLACL
jgi:hypothetical protein